MRSKTILLAGLVLVLVLVLVGGYFYQSPPHQGPAPSSHLISVATSQELLAHIRALNSPIVLVNFWASWCEPCKKEFPELLSLREKLAPKGLQVVFVSIDDPTDFPAAEEFLHSQHVDFQTYYKGDRPLEYVTEIYPKWEGSVPTTVIFGPGLKLLDAWEGEASGTEFEERITRQLKGS